MRSPIQAITPRLLRNRAHSPQRYGAVGDGVTDDTLALQRFFDAISATDVKQAECNGTFGISAGLFIGPATGTMATLYIEGRAKFIALTAIDIMVSVRNCPFFHWNGWLEVRGTGSLSYASRTCRIGVHLGGLLNISRSKFGAISAANLSQIGVYVNDLTTLTDIGHVRAGDCGSGINLAGYSLEANWNTKVDAGSSGSQSQSSVITVDVLPPAVISTRTLVVIGGALHHVNSVDVANSKLTLFPWVDTTLASGTLRYVFGAGVFFFGSDAGICGLTELDAKRCSVGLWSSALYGPVVDRVVTQYCGIGLAIGADASSAHVTLQVNGIYFENNDFDIARLSRAAIALNMLSNYALNFAKIAYVAAPRTTANLWNDALSGTMQTASLTHNGVVHQYEKAPINSFDLASNTTINIFSEPKWVRIFTRNTWTVTLDTPNPDFNRAFGYDSGLLTLLGTGNNLAPTGTITFNCTVGSTVNGGASVAFIGFTAAAVFVIKYNFATTDYRVSCLTHVPTASVAYNPPSLGANIAVITTVALVGAALGDFVEAAFSLDLQGVELAAWVSAADVVSIQFRNGTLGTLDLGNGTLRVRVRKP